MNLDPEDYDLLGYGRERYLEEAAFCIASTATAKNAADLQYAKDNRLEVNARNRRWRNANIKRARAAEAARQRRKYAKDPAKSLARSKAWAQKNRDLVNARRRARYAAQKAAP